MEEIGSYRIIRKIAEGGMAEIFLARQRGIEGLERTVVLKRIQEAYCDNDEFVTMFLDEARLMAVLSHPNLAQVVELGREGRDGYYLVVEYVRGPTLRELLNAAQERGMGGLPIVEALAIAISVAEALSYVHGRRDELGRPLRIVHRDLNPSNVIVSYDGAVKVIDFGIAKAATKVHETRTGVVKGTYGYIAPEQLTGMAPTDHRADIFALGVILYEILLGAHPFDTGQDLDILSRVLSAKYLRPRQMAPGFPPTLERVITRCLAPHPEGRPEDVRLVIDALVAHLESIPCVPTLGGIAALASELAPDADAKVPLGPVPASQVTPLPMDDAAGPTQRRKPVEGTLVKDLPSIAEHHGDEATVTYVAGPPEMVDPRGILLVPSPDLTPTRTYDALTMGLVAAEGGGATDVYTSLASAPGEDSQPSATRPFPTARGAEPLPEVARVLADPTPRPTEADAGSGVHEGGRGPRRYAALLAIGFALLLVSGVGLGAFIATGWLSGGRGSAIAEPPGHGSVAAGGMGIGPPHGGTSPIASDPMIAATESDDAGGPAAHPIDIAPPSTIEIFSTPPGASIALDGQALGVVTPALVTFPRGSDTTWVRVSLEGFVTQELQATRDAEVVRFQLTPLADAGVEAPFTGSELDTGSPDEPLKIRRIRRRRRH